MTESDRHDLFLLATGALTFGTQLVQYFKIRKRIWKAEARNQEAMTLALEEVKQGMTPSPSPIPPTVGPAAALAARYARAQTENSNVFTRPMPALPVKPK